MNDKLLAVNYSGYNTDDRYKYAEEFFVLREVVHGFTRICGIDDSLPPNVPDQLPGRLQRLQAPENQNAGPVN